MGLTLETSVSAFAVFLQGLVSFFSPCVLPLLPLYLGYLSVGARQTDQQGRVVYERRVLRNTFFFVLGVSFAFFLLGLGMSAVSLFTERLLALFREKQSIVRYTVKIGGALLVIMGIMMVTGWMNGVTGYLSGEGHTTSKAL